MHRHTSLRTRTLVCLAGLALTAIAGCGTQVGIAPYPAEIYVELGGTETVYIWAVMDRGDPTVISEGLTITSTDESIATVDNLTVTGVAEGTTTLDVTDGTYTTTATVIVVAAGTIPSELIITPAEVTCTPESANTQLAVFGVMSGGASEDITELATFASDDSSIALVTDAGEVVCVAAGDATVTARYLGVRQDVDVTVGAVPPADVSVTPSSISCVVGETRSVSVVATWESGAVTNVTSAALYVSSDTEVATASSGTITCVGAGTTTVTTGVGGVTDTVSVTVQQGTTGELVDLRFDPSLISCVPAETVTFQLIAEYGEGSTADVTRQLGTAYSTADTSIALISVGSVTCAQSGQTVIQGSYGGLITAATVNVQ